MILCHLNLKQQSEAQKLANSIKIALDQPYYSDFVNFKKWVSG